MKSSLLIGLGISLLTLTSCEVESPDPSYGFDYNTPEFFLARLNPNSTKVSMYSIKKTIEDTDGSIRDAIFAHDSFSSKDECKPITKEYFCYSTIIEDSNSNMKFVDMYIYNDGNIRIDYKEIMYQKVSFYHEMDIDDAKELYNLVKTKIELSKQVK